MPRMLRSTIAVTLLTAATAAVVFVGGQFFRTVAPAQVLATAASGGALTCPRTGCTASTCHAQQGVALQPQGGSGSGSGSGSAGVLVCPRTGCTASTCHATQGGGGGYRWRGQQQGTATQGGGDSVGEAY